MFLFLDPRAHDQIVVGLWASNKEPVFYTYHRDHNVSLPSFVDVLLRKKKIDMATLAGVVAVPGPGGFSNVRSAVLFVNTLIFAAHVPAISIEPQPLEDSQTMFARGIDMLAKSKRKQRSSYIVPMYGGEPNITKPKKR